MTTKITEALPPYMRWQDVSSLVGSLRSSALVACPSDEAECRDALLYCRQKQLSVCTRGGGYSYGDAILNEGNMILDIGRMNRIVAFDENRGLMTVQPGVRLIDVFKAALHKRLTLPASPSESTITIAGAVGMNVNGKDGWRRGNFGDQVVSMKLLLASGEIMTIDRRANGDVFNAVVGGMGLLGVILEITLQLQKIPSPQLRISRVPVHDITALLDCLRHTEETSDFAVVWLDTCARGPRLGRAVVHATEWVEDTASEEELQVKVAASLLRLEKRLRHARTLSPIVGFVVTTMMQIQKISVSLFNRFYFSYSRLRHRLHTADNVESFLRYNFDASFVIPSASAVCGPRGYTVQLTFPRDRAEEALAEILGLCQSSPCLPAKLIMRLHRRDDYLISFSEDGYSLNLEIHPKKRHRKRMERFLEELVETVIRYGGKVHLAKDAVLTRDQFQRLFPNYRKFLDIKRRLDPEELFQSDLYRRLVRDKEYEASMRSSAQTADTTDITPAMATN